MDAMRALPVLGLFVVLLGSTYAIQNAEAVPGDFIVAENGSDELSRVTPSGTITLIASGITGPVGVAVDTNGDFIVTDGNGELLRVTPSGTISLITSGLGELGGPHGVAVDTNGDFIVTELNDGKLSRVTPSGTITTIASGLSFPFGVAVDTNGDFIVAEDSSGELSRVTPSGTITTIASGLSFPLGVAIEPTSNSPPEITAPNDVTVECNEPGGASGVDLGTPTVSDNEDAEGDLVVENDATEPFPLGPTTVNWQVTDTGGLTDSDTQTVTVEDTTAPDIDIPAGFMAIANTLGGWAGDIGQATATDVCDPDPVITNDAPDVFPLGDTVVEWCATDDLGNKTCDDQTINVKPLPVEIDIKPGSFPSSINCKTPGFVPAVIFTEDNFDAIEIEIISMELQGIPVTEIHDTLHPEDVDDDGDLDAVVHLEKAAVCEATSDFPLKESVEVTLTGQTTDGIPFEGIGDIRITKR